MIFLINANSTVCSDYDHVRVKNDEDVDKEKEVYIENIIKI